MMTDNEIWNMSPREIAGYLERHPEDAGHIAKVCYQSSILQGVKTIRYRLGKRKHDNH